MQDVEVGSVGMHQKLKHSSTVLCHLASSRVLDLAALITVHLALSFINAASAPSFMAEKKIISRAHLDAFLHSQTHTDVVEFIEALNEASIGIKLGDACYESEVGRRSNNSKQCLDIS